ncbi:MAG: hypothetical protein A2166_00185 [Omnitrophica WOR_2 bacterium RBG_13_41_10]|nr:MAG: hypothetical protein A2166_00185 [Omnitrophica WOR_2 bacterium RBG_13_41_10]
MENQDTTQLELFSKESNFMARKENRPSFSFFSYLRNYEKTIFMVMGFLVTAIASFSLGVKKGKEALLAKTNAVLDIASITKQAPLLIKAQGLPVNTPAAPLKETLNYTIQVASFVNNAFAQKEAQTLRKKGLSVLVLAKGKHTIVCVGNFANQDSAKLSLSQLRKNYRDCFIRRL